MTGMRWKQTLISPEFSNIGMDNCFICISHNNVVISTLGLAFRILFTVAIVFQFINIKVPICKLKDLQNGRSYYMRLIIVQYCFI